MTSPELSPVINTRSLMRRVGEAACSAFATKPYVLVLHGFRIPPSPAERRAENQILREQLQLEVLEPASEPQPELPIDFGPAER